MKLTRSVEVNVNSCRNHGTIELYKIESRPVESSHKSMGVGCPVNVEHDEVRPVAIMHSGHLTSKRSLNRIRESLSGGDYQWKNSVTDWIPEGDLVRSI